MKREQKSYCRICGKEKTQKLLLKTFDEQTGKQNFQMICPDSEKCTHGCDMKYRDDLKVFSFKSQPELRCTRCGKLEQCTVY